jgi:DNA-binding IclR family transcriptional regulator
VKKPAERGAAAPRRGIRSVGTGLAVVRALAAVGGPLPLKEIAARSGMPPDKAFRYLVSFVDCGLVVQDPASANYDLGPLALEIGLAALGRINELEVVTAALREVTSATGHDAHATAWTVNGPTVIRWMQGADEIALKVREGVVLPLLGSATGRVWAAHLPRAAVAPLLEAELATLAVSSDSTPEQLRVRVNAELAAATEQTVLASRSERRLGVDALAGPIVGPDGIAFAITLMGPQGNLDLSPKGRTRRALEAALLAASQALTGRRLASHQVTAPALPARRQIR